MTRILTDNACAQPLCRPHITASKFLVSALLGTTLLTSPALFGTGNGYSGLFNQMAEAQELPSTTPGAQLLLTADELVYDNDNEIVTAVGNVQLDFDGYNVVAQRVSYNQKTGRVKAFGNVEILEPDGNRIYADEIDLTDDFGEGFINALRVETPDNTRFAAESAERFAGQKTVFHHGVYTACEPCKEKPDRAPIWQVKAQKVILNGVEKTVAYKHARFELFGLPIAYLPYFKHADSSVKRKTGFLTPTLGYSDTKGAWIRQPYFIATGDSHDLTVTATGFSQQGVLGQAEWRHQLENGSYTLTLAGIDQQDPNRFTALSNDANETGRGMIGSKGRFDINPRWSFGWNILAQTDGNFSRTYDIEGYDTSNFTNDIYLRGLHNKSYFDLSAKQYLVQNSFITNTGNAFEFESSQPIVRPVLDYNFVKSEDLTGGEVNLDVNITSIDRSNLSTVTPLSGDTRTHGIAGDTTRASIDLGWKKQITTTNGLLVTPSLSVRGDWTTTSAFSAPVNALNTGAVQNGSYTRFLPTAGLEVSYPLLARMAGSTHVFEPTAQLFVRPDLAFNGVAANEDAQSLVFDATTLFQRDKFSGYDRIESGTRANIGLRYSGQFESGLSLNGLIGQSFHLAGDNPYAREDDLTNTGENSGLESSESDIVASLAAITPSGITFNAKARFDDDDFGLERGEVDLAYRTSRFTLSGNYTFIDSQPDAGFDTDRQQVGFGSTINFHENWRLFGAAQYDIDANKFISDSIGLAYHDECFTFSLAFQERRTRSTNFETSRLLSFKIALRTIGEYEGDISGDDFSDFVDNSDF